MVTFIKGDVVVLAFPYSDFSQGKKRPAVVLAVPRDDEIIVCQITGRNTRPEYTIPIAEDDFVEGGLQKSSFVRPDHIYTIEPKLIHYKAGTLSVEKISAIIDAATEILREK